MKFRPFLYAALFSLSISLAAHSKTLEQQLMDTLKRAVKEQSLAVPESQAFAAGASYTVCFTPGQNCEKLIVKEINIAQENIRVQAYSFTSLPIANALINAQRRGIDVQVILDESHRKDSHSVMPLLKKNRIPIMIDERPAIAHSKIMIFDQNTVLTGSYNFTKSAQERNAENVLLIQGDTALTKRYNDNWMRRKALSTY